MKKQIYLLVMVLIAFATGTFAQNITISSGGAPIATGINQTIPDTICEGDSLILTVSYAGVMDHVIWACNIGGATAFAPNNTNFMVTVHPSELTDYTVWMYDAPAPAAPVGYLKLSVFISSKPETQDVLINGVNGLNTTIRGCTLGVYSFVSSEIGTKYQMRDAITKVPIGTEVDGTGNSIEFDPVPTGNYEVKMTTSAGCYDVNH